MDIQIYTIICLKIIFSIAMEIEVKLFWLMDMVFIKQITQKMVD